ncbi:hypothetical protein [Halapricum hydrolyticum]|uniref:Uncharacterized protein n=1 Tax=Halapricum hydrolyticum TaxID=2979991 RepID=A0AAE3IAK9_9EURY|nr:hypothetical protein [Halapricum hydrolyticum]MCU4717847.1 hypothetical protein [Halapricum hydrolyticum]MCU4727011.1 hypothetical protein [Halapricum hydrolyticum]
MEGRTLERGDPVSDPLVRGLQPLRGQYGEQASRKLPRNGPTQHLGDAVGSGDVGVDRLGE